MSLIPPVPFSSTPVFASGWVEKGREAGPPISEMFVPKLTVGCELGQKRQLPSPSWTAPIKPQPFPICKALHQGPLFALLTHILLSSWRNGKTHTTWGLSLPPLHCRGKGTGLFLSLFYFCTHSSTGAPQLSALFWDWQTRGLQRDEGEYYRGLAGLCWRKWWMMVKVGDFEVVRDAPPLLWGVSLSNSLSNGVRPWLHG